MQFGKTVKLKPMTTVSGGMSTNMQLGNTIQMKLFVNNQGHILGPIDVDRILALAQNGRLPPDVTVSDDRVNWFTISELQSLLGKKTKEAVSELRVEPPTQGNTRTVNLPFQSGGNQVPPPPMGGPQGYNQGTPYGAPPMGGMQGYNLEKTFAGSPMGGQQGYNQDAPYSGQQASNQAVPYGTAQINSQGMPYMASQDGGLQQRISMPGAIQGNDVCPVCGQPIVPNASVCQHCGTHFRFCPSCGVRVTRQEQVVCTQCGCALGNAVGPITGRAVGVGGISSMRTMNSPITNNDNLKEIIQKSWTTLKWCYVIGLISGCIWDFFYNEKLYHEERFHSPYGFLLYNADQYLSSQKLCDAILTISLLIFLPCAILGLIAYYRMLKSNWHYVGPKVGNTAGQMAGFLFIPVFHLYWQFETIWGLAKVLEANGKRVNSNIAFSLCFLNCCWVIVCILFQTSLNKVYLSFLALAIQIALIVLFYKTHGQINKAIIED